MGAGGGAKDLTPEKINCYETTEGTKTQDCSTNKEDSTILKVCIILKYLLAATISRTLIN
jgi:hypothetical protein